MVGWKGRIYTVLARFLPKKLAHQIRYYHWNHRWPDLDNPKLFTEKLIWLNQYNEIYSKELIQEIYDKYTVRKYIEDKGLSHILIKQYGRFKTADEINFDELPEEYILKTTQSSGQNIIVTKGSTLSREEIRSKMNKWVSGSNELDSLQGYYYTDNNSIICEELLKTPDGKIPKDFRICCCNGKARWIYCDLDTIDEDMKHKDTYHREYFDVDWNYLPIDNYNRTRLDKEKATTPKPESLKEMIEISEILSKDFVFMRVDLYDVEGKLYFGELTPIPGMAGGFDPPEWDEKFGDMIELPKVKVW